MTQQTIDPVDGDITLSLKKPHNLNVTLSPESNEKLSRLADATGLNKSVLVRQMIEYRYIMGCQQVPLCATGARCYVPNMHPPAQSTPHQNLIPGEAPGRPVGA